MKIMSESRASLIITFNEETRGNPLITEGMNLMRTDGSSEFRNEALPVRLVRIETLKDGLVDCLEANEETSRDVPPDCLSRLSIIWSTFVGISLFEKICRGDN